MAASTSKHVLVVGGAGFLGSAITKRLVNLGHTVTSLSPSGRPFLTPAGHQPAWSASSAVQWSKGDALRPETFLPYLEGQGDAGSSSSSNSNRRPVDAVVSTIGILLEGDYKGPGGSLGGTVRALMKGWGLEKGNPLETEKRGMYEKMNRDAALSVAQTWSSVLQQRRPAASPPPPFIFISAEDIFRPIIDPRYITTKREAEAGLEQMSWQDMPSAVAGSSAPSSQHRPEQETPDSDGAGLTEEINRASASLDSHGSATASSLQRIFRPVFIRPGLMYHPHTRPLSTLPSTLLDISALIHSSLPSVIPTPADALRLAGQGPLAKLLTLSPLHVDTVAKAVGASLSDDSVFGPVDTQRIKKLAGFKEDFGGPGQEEAEKKAASMMSAQSGGAVKSRGWSTQGRS